MSDLSTKQSQQQVELMQQALANVDVYIFIKNIELEYTFVNPLVAELFELDVEDIIGKDDTHFFELAMSNQLRQNDLQVIEHGLTIQTEETNVLKNTGETRIYRSTKKPLFDDKGKVIGLCGVSTDITEEKRLQRIIDKQQSLINAVLDNVDAHIYMKDETRHFKYVNKRVADLFGRPVDDIVGKLDTEVLPKEIADHFWLSDKLVFDTQTKQVINEVANDAEGNRRHYMSVKMPYLDEDDVRSLIGFSTDVTELFLLKEEFKKLATIDSLTGLFNRRHFVDQAEEAFIKAEQFNQALSVVSLDVDYFKKVNDQYGHPTGDLVLQKVAENLNKYVRGQDVLARIGGEEFAIIMPEVDKEQARVAAEKLRVMQLETPIQTSQGKINIAISLGVASLTESDKDFDQIFSRADKALYQAKNAGRNQVKAV
ncbi:diguanylate cyclase [Catenovulum sp. SM1970]|uniref:sensor domain-containing diguanylate cyclase n=1 Tax=Marinifaba aquimaris TaxID=2741323 RepID=UPI00157375CB|nr:diguanylate cyclase [Marinifaba aquimaris]NTS75771.1 diguanylate cyclase [Marinifaba aquimaris]